MSAQPEEGAAAPDFDLASSSGARVSRKGLKGRPYLLYFYPNDDTPGCTVEACEFGQQHPKFQQAGLPVYGVSPNDLDSHAKFIKKFSLPFELLVDEGHAVAEAYGLWVEKNNFGKAYMGVQRASFLIGKDGKVLKAWPKVKPEGHAAEVLAAAKELL